MHIFIHTDVGSFGGKLCKFCPFLYFGRTGVDVLWLHSKSNYINLCKRFRLFYTKNLLFLFYIITFTKHPHQFIYYTHFFIKIIFSLTFLLLFPTYPHLTFLFSLNNPFFFFFFFFFRLSLSLSPLYLCLSFFSIFFFFLRIFFLPFLRQPITSTPSTPFFFL